MADGKFDFKEILSKIKDFFVKLKPFFKKIGPFFKTVWEKLKVLFGKLREFEWNPKKMTTSQKRKLLVYGGGALLILILLIVIIAIIVHAVNAKKDAAASGYSFTTDGYEDITDAECLNEQVIVYTDKKGNKGLITLDGVITEKADQEKIYTVTTDWRNTIIVAENSESNYPLYVDTESGKVLTRQYQGGTDTAREAVWSDESNCLVWRNSDGSINSVQKTDVVLTAGLYPVAYYNGSGTTYGYIDQNLNLVINHTFSDACDFSEGLAAVARGSKWGYIDTTGKTIIPIEYSAIGEKGFSFRNGLVPVKNKDGMCGIITRTGETACRFDFDVILQGKDGKYLAQKDGKWGLLTVNSDVYSTANTTSATTTAAKVMYVVSTSSGGTLNMRAAADASAEKITEIPNGTELEYIESGDNWIKVRWNDYEGWVSAAYVEQVS